MYCLNVGFSSLFLPSSCLYLIRRKAIVKTIRETDEKSNKPVFHQAEETGIGLYCPVYGIENYGDLMSTPPSDEVTQLLKAWTGGDDERALDRLTAFVYEELQNCME